ncbi:MAG TPA: PTS sugar transporter subunit IIB, partial [Erysipelotrichaceae bacterium]|nr:PTS sugar transporter subunit IIB [Erysipelotrichaceae bacterium]
MNIMLTCSAGMSTSLLVLHMQDEAKKRGLEANIWAVSETTVKKEYAEKQI